MMVAIANRLKQVGVEVVPLICLVLGIYFTRLPALPLSLDEPLWGTVAQEMIWTGDWIVPRQHNLVFPDRPPAQSWLIAYSILLTGNSDSAAPRIPSALATLFTALLIYGFSRTILSPRGAFYAGAAYVTMWEVMFKGSTADSEAVFTFFVAASLLFWILGYVRKWPSAATWITGYLFAAMAALTKGAQGLCFFVAPVVVFLFLQRDWRFLCSRFHALGLAVFAVVFGAWLVPFWLKTNPLAAKDIFLGIVGQRFDQNSIAAVIKHLIVYPLDVLAMMLPWSLLLALYAWRDFRQSLAAVPRVPVTFLLVTVAVCFLPVWLPPGSHGRYFMPLFPCVAPLLGIVLERLMCPAEGMRISRVNRTMLFITSAVILIISAAILIASWFRVDSYLAQPKWFAVFYFAAGAAVAGTVFWARRNPGGRCVRLSVLMIAAFIGLSFTGARTNQYVRYKVDIQSAVDAAKKQLPPDAKLVSLGYLHPVFAYYFARPIPLKLWPKHPADVTLNTEYFCFSADLHPDAKLPFAWTKIASVRCDRGSLTPSSRSVIIGHRLDDTLDKQQSPAP